MCDQFSNLFSLKKVFTYILTLLTCVLALSGCSSKPKSEIYYYLLDQAPSPHISPARSTLIEVAPIELPRYLKQQHLLILGEENHLTRANYHYWADDLGPSIRRTLIRHLDDNNEKYSAVINCSACKQIVLQINHFYPTQKGEVILSGNFHIKENGTGTPDRKVHRESFSLHTKIKETGYAHSVKLMNKLLNELSLQIIRKLP